MTTRIYFTLSPFTRNKNTGNFYEIAVALALLRQMGVSNDELESDNALLESIAIYNNKKTTELRMLFETIRTKPVGERLVFDGKRIVRIECITQDDSIGRTGDLLLHAESGEVVSLSICEGKPARDGVISKCLTNPSAKRFGCTAEDCAQFNTIEAQAVVEYKAYMLEKYGADESTWPSRVKTNIAIKACTEVASIVEARFASFADIEKQKKIINDLLRIEDGHKPADYLVLVDKKTLMLRFYRFDTSLSAHKWEPRLKSKGINLIVENAGKEIGSIQVKFNNGIYQRKDI
jgi:predicted RNA-binding protein with PUA domain